MRGKKEERKPRGDGGQAGRAGRERPVRTDGLTCGEVDVGEEDDVGGDQGDQLGHADLLLEVDVDHVVVAQAAVCRRVKLPEAGAEAAQEPGRRQNTKIRRQHSWGKNSDIHFRSRGGALGPESHLCA